jgi:amidase
MGPGGVISSRRGPPGGGRLRSRKPASDDWPRPQREAQARAGQNGPQVPRPPDARRQFLHRAAALAAAGPAGAGAALPPTPAPERAPAHAGVAALRPALDAGALSSAELVQALFARADAIDADGPRLNAIVERNGQALAIAHAMDHEQRRGRRRGPLHGIPVLLKDNVDTGDDMLTTAGSLALAGRPAPADAALVERLRAAGAIVLGKTNLSEWANFRGTRSVSGWSARGGFTRNPHVLDRSPSGSSSGSAVAVAASLAPLAVGTETDGSIVTPAAMCGVVGVKPTVGLVSRRGLVPISHSQDTAGPLARSVADAALLLQAMAAGDRHDGATAGGAAADAGRTALDGLRLTAGAPSGALQGARLGVAREFFGVHPGADGLAEAALAALRDAGAVLVDPVRVLADAAALGAAEYEVLLHEFRHGLDAYLRRRGPSARVASLRELIAFNEAHAAEELAWFGQEHLIEALRRGPLGAPAYRRALATCRRLAHDDGLAATLARHRLDAVVAPTTGPAYPLDPVLGDHFPGGCSQPAAVAGCPHVSLPVGAVRGLPVGLSLFGARWHDARLLALAHDVEQVAGRRVEPRFRATLALAG